MVERIAITSREQWLELRRHDITASDVAAVLGLSPYKTPLQVWAEKVGKAKEGQENAAMRRGRWLEGAVIHALEEERPRWAITNLRSGLYLRDPEARIGATPDAVAATSDGEIIVQCKVVARPVFDAWDGPPIGYQLQALTEASLWDAPYAIVAALIIDTYSAELWISPPIERNCEAEQKIRAAVKKFWEQTESGEIPQADYSRDSELLAALYPPRTEVEPLDLSSDNRLPELLEEREAVARHSKICADRLSELNAEVVEKLAGSTKAVLPGWRISRTLTHRKEHLVAAASYPVLRVRRSGDE